MTKTQIQVPDELLEKARELARRKEWSLAETFRRGVELLVERYPSHPDSRKAKWSPPSSSKVGWNGLTRKQLKALAFQEEAEPNKD